MKLGPRIHGTRVHISGRISWERPAGASRTFGWFYWDCVEKLPKNLLSVCFRICDDESPTSVSISPASLSYESGETNVS